MLSWSTSIGTSTGGTGTFIALAILPKGNGPRPLQQLSRNNIDAEDTSIVIEGGFSSQLEFSILTVVVSSNRR